MVTRTPIQESFESLSGMNCFACAPKRLNAVGLDLVFEKTEDGARTAFCLPPQFQSYPGFLHGGITATILDETMAYAGVFQLHVLPFTRSLQLNFRRAVSAGVEYSCAASVTGRESLRYEARGTIQDQTGRALVSACAEFSIPTLAMARKMLDAAEVERFKDFFR